MRLPLSFRGLIGAVRRWIANLGAELETFPLPEFVWKSAEGAAEPGISSFVEGPCLCLQVFIG